MAAVSSNPISMTLQVVHTARTQDFDLANGVFSKELGLHKATRGLFTARRTKAAGRWDLPQIASPVSRPRFSFLYLLGGTLEVRSESGPVTLHDHDAATQLALSAETLISASEQLEFLEIQAADSDRARNYLPEMPDQIISLDCPDVHVVGQGPRSYFDYRELGVSAATGRRLDVQVVRAQKAREGGTGWHSHNMAQLTYGLSGWALLGVEGKSDPVLKERGDALCIPADIAHNAGAFSDDYWALQLQIPADFDTVARPVPKSAL